MVVLTLNIFAVNLADRGATITPVHITYPHKTSLGRSFVTPMMWANRGRFPGSYPDGAWRTTERPGNRKGAQRVWVSCDKDCPGGRG